MSNKNKSYGVAFGILSLIGALGVVASLVAGDRARFWVNWNFWFLFLLTIGLGALFIVALEYLVAARWSVPIRRAAERASSLTILAAPAVLIGLFSLPVIYPWATEGPKSAIVAGPPHPSRCTRRNAALSTTLLESVNAERSTRHSVRQT